MPSNLEDEYKLDALIDVGFERRKCVNCGGYFWTLDEKRDTCGDPPCDDYEFIENPPIEKNYGLSDMREHFLQFFEERDHERASRRPVAARWRDDIFLTIASIANFQPHVTSGEVPPPSNPLTISQPCIRLEDIDSVGKSGRHLTTFEMMAHHAFNFNSEDVYWKDKTVELCQELLEGLGVEKEEITYKEDPWAGGGNAGPAFEVLCGGLELATLVFMNMVEDDSGNYRIKDSTYSMMDSKIVDTGYGLERFVWASKGSPTVYDAAFGDIVDEVMSMASLNHKLDDDYYRQILSENAKFAGYIDVDSTSSLKNLRKRVANKIGLGYEELIDVLEPVENAYAVVDHSRAAAFMLGDGIVPSNTKAGYLVRLVIRRALRMMNSLGMEQPLADVVALHVEDMSDDFPEIEESEDRIYEIAELEEDRFSDTIEKGKNLIRKTAKKYKSDGGQIPKESAIELYDTHGVPLEITEKVAGQLGVSVEIPDNFYAQVAHFHEEKKDESEESKKKGSEDLIAPDLSEKLEELPDTKVLYYNQTEDASFEAVVLDSFGGKVILDQTLFYPEGGGQIYDTGTLDTGEKIYDVVNVQKYGDIIVHELDTDDEIRKGEVVNGKVDEERRDSIKRHHTATHQLLGACRKLFGTHVWQAGSKVRPDKARLDITHYKNISEEELKEIELVVNKVSMENREISFEILERNDAEEEYGFSIYQGGVPRGNDLRIMDIEGWNAQACGGLHCDNTGKVGPCKILGIERVQDGVIRINLSAGKAAVKNIQAREDILSDSASVFSVETEDLPKTAKRFFNEWKKRGKEIEKLRKELASEKKKSILENAKEIKGVTFVSDYIEDAGMNELRTLALGILEPSMLVALMDKGGNLVISVGEKAQDYGITAEAIFNSMTEEFGGGGGGDEEMAQGKVQIDDITYLTKAISDIISERLR